MGVITRRTRKTQPTRMITNTITTGMMTAAALIWLSPAPVFNSLTILDILAMISSALIKHCKRRIGEFPKLITQKSGNLSILTSSLVIVSLHLDTITPTPAGNAHSISVRFIYKRKIKRINCLKSWIYYELCKKHTGRALRGI